MEQTDEEKQAALEEAEARRLRKLELDDLRAVLRTPEGRSVLWRLMGKARIFESIYSGTELIRYNAGQQDLGHFIWAEIEEAEPEALFQMMRANQKKKGDKNV